MEPIEMRYSCKVTFTSHATAVTNSACVAPPIEHQPIDVGAMACVRARTTTTCGVIAVPIRIGKVLNASSSVIAE